MKNSCDPHRRYKEEEDPLDQQQYQYQYQYPPSQAWNQDQLSTGLPHTLPRNAVVFESDVSMQDIPLPVYSSSWGYRVPASEHPSSSTTSWFDINTPGSKSVVTDGSFMIVPSQVPSHNRAYSNESNATSGSPLYSDPNLEPQAGDWQQEAEYAVDNEAMEEDEMMFRMPHDQKGLLVGLYSSEPRIVFDPYQAALQPHPEQIIYQETMETYETSSSPQQLLYNVLPFRAKVQNPTSDPWNQMDQRMSAYPAGFTAFAPSPGPNAECYDQLSAERASVPASPNATQTLERPSLSRKGKEREQGWEHVVVAKGGLSLLNGCEGEDAISRGERKSGVRTGKLKDEAREKAKKIRQMKACWNCWIQKVPCSEGKTCERCKSMCKKQPSLSTHQLCWRSGFKDYETAFFPEFLHSHLRKSKIEDLISEHTTGFLDTVLILEVSTGSVFKPMRLQTNAFVAKTGELLQQSSLTPAEPDQSSQLVQRPSAPVGILGLSLSDMKRKCSKHIDEMIANPQYAAQATASDVSQLPKEILEIVCEYAAKKDSPVLKNALKLHAIHYFMSSLITFSEDSAREVYMRLAPDAPQYEYLSSRLLSRQIKYCMHKLHRELTVSVLEELERSLRSRTKDSWGPSFSALLVVFLCIERLQTATDMMVVCDLKDKGNGCKYTRDQSYEACEELDKYPFRQCMRLFHEIYRSRRDGRLDKSFNPLRMVSERRSSGLEKERETEAMIRKVYGIISGKWTEIQELSDRPAMIHLGYLPDPNDIKNNNTGRLAAKFLRSFFPETERHE